MSRIRPRCLLLDTDVVVYLYSTGLWTHVVKAFEVTVPSTIVHEAQYFRDLDGVKHQIDLATLVAAQEVIEISASADDLKVLSERLTRYEWEGLHAGEREALALVLTSKYDQGRFCSGDKAPIETLAALGFAEQGVSLEAILKATGSDLNRQVRPWRQFSEEYFKQYNSKGSVRMVQGLV